ncbi:MAG: hypothetical protein QOG02_1918, partial [Gaiellales bacterium]|nr:hypothetical protein [Gaiellales bacterium]
MLQPTCPDKTPAPVSDQITAVHVGKPSPN